MLFLQAAIAFAACEAPGRSAAMTRAVAMASMADCHQGGDEALCLAHCASQDEAVFKAQLTLPVLAAPSQFLVAVAREPVASIVPIVGSHHAAGPPPRILFQSFLL